MIFKEVGQTMDPLLVNVAEGHHIDARVVEEILQVEKRPCVSKKPSYSLGLSDRLLLR